jgi:hypothetical protein
MAKNNPVIIWVIKHIPKIEPKFHHAEMLIGAGRSTKALLAILIKGCLFRVFIIIDKLCFVEVLQIFLLF